MTSNQCSARREEKEQEETLTPLPSFQLQVPVSWRHAADNKPTRCGNSRWRRERENIAIGIRVNPVKCAFRNQLVTGVCSLSSSPPPLSSSVQSSRAYHSSAALFSSVSYISWVDGIPNKYRTWEHLCLLLRLLPLNLVNIPLLLQLNDINKYTYKCGD